MTSNELSALGDRLRRDYNDVVRRLSGGWLTRAASPLSGLSNLPALYRQMDRLVDVVTDFAGLEEALTSNFLPSDLGAFADSVETERASFEMGRSASAWSIDVRPPFTFAWSDPPAEPPPAGSEMPEFTARIDPSTPNEARSPKGTSPDTSTSGSAGPPRSPGLSRSVEQAPQQVDAAPTGLAGSREPADSVVGQERPDAEGIAGKTIPHRHAERGAAPDSSSLAEEMQGDDPHGAFVPASPRAGRSTVRDLKEFARLVDAAFPEDSSEVLPPPRTSDGTVGWSRDGLLGAADSPVFSRSAPGPPRRSLGNVGSEPSAGETRATVDGVRSAHRRHGRIGGAISGAGTPGTDVPSAAVRGRAVRDAEAADHAFPDAGAANEPTLHDPTPSERQMDGILEALANHVAREYRRFYGD